MTVFANEYPEAWAEIAKLCKDTAEWCCVRCGEAHNPSDGYCLTVHHLDGDKNNCVWWNLAALCQRCHLHIQGKVDMRRIYMFEHSDWFKPFVAGYYAHLRGLPETREYISENLADLLDITKLGVTE